LTVQEALDGAPIFVHLDLDVLDPEDFPAAVPAPNGLHPDKLYDLMDSVLEDSELLGLEVTNFAVPDDEDESAVATETAMHHHAQSSRRPNGTVATPARRSPQPSIAEPRTAMAQRWCSSAAAGAASR